MFLLQNLNYQMINLKFKKLAFEMVMMSDSFYFNNLFTLKTWIFLIGIPMFSFLLKHFFMYNDITCYDLIIDFLDRIREVSESKVEQ